MRGQPVSLIRSFQVGLRPFFPIIGLAICASLLTMLATALFIVPGVIVFLMLFVATPVCVVERLGPFRSMERSAQLTQGHRWKILGMLLLMLLPAVVVIGVFETIEELAGAGVVADDGLPADVEILHPDGRRLPPSRSSPPITTCAWSRKASTPSRSRRCSNRSLQTP